MITITHTHEGGTLIEGSRKGDGVWEVLKATGDNWRYSRNIGLYLGHSRDKLAQGWIIDRAAEALRKAGHEVTISIDESQRRDIAAIEADRALRAEARAEHYAERAERAGAEANATYARARQMAEAIPFGQPVLSDHYSAGRDRNYRARMGRTYDRAFEGMAEAERLAGRAQAAEANQSHRESIPATLRRIEKLEADERSWVRALEGKPDSRTSRDPETWEPKPAEGAYKVHVETELAAIREQLAYWRQHVASAEAGGVKVWTRADFTRDDFALCRGTWYQVQRVNAKSLTVMWGTNTHLLPAVTRDNVRHAMGPSDRTGTIGYDDIRGRKSAAEMAEILAAAETVTA